MKGFFPGQKRKCGGGKGIQPKIDQAKKTEGRLALRADAHQGKGGKRLAVVNLRKLRGEKGRYFFPHPLLGGAGLMKKKKGKKTGDIREEPKKITTDNHPPKSNRPRGQKKHSTLKKTCLGKCVLFLFGWISAIWCEHQVKGGKGGRAEKSAPGILK